jgi:hypothetical protein
MQGITVEREEVVEIEVKEVVVQVAVAVEGAVEQVAAGLAMPVEIKAVEVEKEVET